MGGWHGMGWPMGWGWLFLLLIVVGAVLLVAALVRGRTSGKQPSPPEGRSRARAILDERYASGEIDKAEYQERVEQLGEHG